MLRFARRASCPACGGGRVLSLRTEEERADFSRLSRRARANAGQGGGNAVLYARLAEWAPARAWLAIAFGVLLLAPAVGVRLVWGRDGFRELWVRDDLSTVYEGLSTRGLEMIAAALAGGLLLAFVLVTRLARSASGAASKGPAPRTLLVYLPSPLPQYTTVLRGVARPATVSLESPVAAAPCVAFGLHGDVDGTQIDDAEGGDFDLELESGERVMVSLEHAILVDDGAAATPSVVARTAHLDELLGDRGIGAGEVRVAEVLVREGDVITIEAEVTGGVTLSFGERGSHSRLASGAESSPLVVRLTSSGSGASAPTSSRHG